MPRIGIVGTKHSLLYAYSLLEQLIGLGVLLHGAKRLSLLKQHIGIFRASLAKILGPQPRCTVQHWQGVGDFSLQPLIAGKGHQHIGHSGIVPSPSSLSRAQSSLQ